MGFFDVLVNPISQASRPFGLLLSKVMPYDPSDSFYPSVDYAPRKPATLDAYHMMQERPELASAISLASRSVGCLTTRGGQHLGCGVLIGVDRLLVSRHVLLGGCPHHFQVTFGGVGEMCSFAPRSYDVQSCVEDRPGLDYCILKLSRDENRHYPGNVIPIPRFAYEQPGDDYLLSHVDVDGMPVVSIGNSCLGPSWGGNYCSVIESVPGSSGGGYFNAKGELFAIHLSRSTGHCGGTSAETKAVSLLEIARQSAVLSEHRCRALSDHIPYCLPPEERYDPCFADEGKDNTISGNLTSHMLPDGRVLSGGYAEVSRAGKTRDIRVYINLEGKKGKTISLFDGKFSLGNPHEFRQYNKKGQESFYYTAAEHIFHRYRNKVDLSRNFSFSFNELPVHVSMIELDHKQPVVTSIAPASQRGRTSYQGRGRG